MLNKSNKMLKVFIVVLVLFITAGSVYADDVEESRFARAFSGFTNIFNYSGAAQHEHQFNFYNGMAGVIGMGRGQLGGTHHGWSVEPKTGSLFKPIAANIQNYYAATAGDALPGQYMRVVGGFSMPNSHSVQSGVEVAPGSEGYVKDAMAVRSGDGGYFEHSNNTGTENGRTRVQSGIEDTSSANVDVEGFAMYYEKTVVDGGGQKTGWWDTQFSGEGSSW